MQQPRPDRPYYYATPLPQPGAPKNYPQGGSYTLQCYCEAEGKPTLGAGVRQVDKCNWEPASQCMKASDGSAKCPTGYTQRATCHKTETSWPDNLYSTNIPYKPSFYQWNEYMGFIGYPAGAHRNVYENGRHWPAPSDGKPCVGFGC